MEKQVIVIGEITLEWSNWAIWEDIKIDCRSGCGIHIPNNKPGVYEVRIKNKDERLTIGKASDLRMRGRQALVKGKVPHSSGDNIRNNEDVSQIEVRWAQANRPAAVEEELHKLYREKYNGHMPKYTGHT